MATSTESPAGPGAEFETTLAVLRDGEIRLSGLFSLGSNTTLLCEIDHSAGTRKAVYKPVRGERPLWDFPPGSLARREAAAFETACALGWPFVPPTVYRESGPFGPGSCQEFRDLDLEWNYFSIREEDPASLQRVAVFDTLINNADRKAMHLSRDSGGRLWLIDHGLCFHVEPKLRTVIWDFAAQPVPESILAAVESFAGRLARPGGIAATLAGCLSAPEVQALAGRAQAILRSGCFPEPGPGRNVPWPIWA